MHLQVHLQAHIWQGHSMWSGVSIMRMPLCKCCWSPDWRRLCTPASGCVQLQHVSRTAVSLSVDQTSVNAWLACLSVCVAGGRLLAMAPPLTWPLLRVAGEPQPQAGRLAAGFWHRHRWHLHVLWPQVDLLGALGPGHLHRDSTSSLLHHWAALNAIHTCAGPVKRGTCRP